VEVRKRGVKRVCVVGEFSHVVGHLRLGDAKKGPKGGGTTRFGVTEKFFRRNLDRHSYTQSTKGKVEGGDEFLKRGAWRRNYLERHEVERLAQQEGGVLEGAGLSGKREGWS